MDTLSGLRPLKHHFKTASLWMLIALLAAAAQLPGKLRLQLGKYLGQLFYLVNAKRRRIARINLEMCFPHWPIEKRRQVMMDHFKLYGQAAVDIGMLSRSSESRLNCLMNIEGIEHFRKARNAGHPVIFLAPHSVGIDFAGTLLARHLPLCSMMRDQKQSILTKRMKKNRTRFGLKLYSRSQGLLPLIRNLKRKINCFYIADEDFGTNNSLFVPFFGVPVATLNTLGRMARITDAKVLPVRSILDSRSGRYNVTIEQALQEFPTDDEYTNARRMNAVFEDVIAAAPEQYIWTLKWFKTRPNDAASPY